MKPEHIWAAICILAAFAISEFARGATYTVNPDGTGDYPTIQAAIDAAVDDDVVELTDGTYAGEGNRVISYAGKAITVRSQSGNPDACIIDCEEEAFAFNFDSGEGSLSVLEGLTMKSGIGRYIGWGDNYEGGAIYCESASPTIKRCIFRENSAYSGGGLICKSSSPTISECRFTENSATYGAGIRLLDSSPTLEGCELSANVGTAVDVTSYCEPILISCTIVGHSSGAMGCGFESTPTLISCTLSHNFSGIVCFNNGSPTLINSIIAFTEYGMSINCFGDGSSATLTCCDLYDNAGGDWVDCIAAQQGVEGNISLDPLFCDAPNGDFTLRADSPCAPFSGPNAECDLIGAWPVSCDGPTAVQSSSWGRIKAFY